MPRTLIIYLLALGFADSRFIQNEYSNSLEQTSDDEVIDLSAYGGTIFGIPDNTTTGKLVSQSAEAENPEELGTYLEGDLLIPIDSTQENLERNGIVARSSRWPGGILPYEISGKFSTQELGVIKYAMEQYHAGTCVRFKPRTNEKDYIAIVNGNSGCWSGVGRTGGRQEVNLQSPNCLRTYGTPIHELMHAVGFFHEQNRNERDAYVKVLTQNVKPEMLINFEKSNPKTEYAYGVEYDYASVMHYSDKSFSRNGQPTLIALHKTNESTLMGQRRGFSKNDLRKINAMYKCKR